MHTAAAAVAPMIWMAVGPACEREDRAGEVVRAAGAAYDPWTCPEESTQTFEVAQGRYRLRGCGRVAVYDCDMIVRPYRCQRSEAR